MTQIDFSAFSDEEMFTQPIGLEKKYESGANDKDPPRKQNSLGLSGPGNTSRQSGMNTIRPPYSMSKLGALPELNHILKSCIEAMAVNVAMFPGVIECRVKIVEREVTDPDTGQVKKIKVNEATGQEITEQELLEIQEDYLKAHQFISSACLDYSFSTLMHRKHINFETYGNSYWEVTKDNEGVEYVGLSLLNTEEIELCEIQDEAIEIKQYVLNTITNEYKTIDRMKRFRRYVQTKSTGVRRKLYYKEFGDPRRMNAIDGKYLAMGETPPENFIEATEVLHWRIYNPRSEYGIPRHSSRIIHLLGSRAADLIQYLYLKNNGIPPAILIVEGYRGKELQKRVTDWISAKKKKGDIFGSLLVLEAEPQAGGSAGSGAKAMKPNIRLEKLSNVMSKDAMFSEYIKDNDKGTISAYRLTNQFVGATEDLNRAVAETADEIVHKQVFIPERMAQDEFINSNLFNALRIRYHYYKSTGVTLEDAEKLSKLAIEFSKAGGIDINELRAIAAQALGKQYEARGGKMGDLSAMELDAMLKNPLFIASLLGQEQAAPTDENAPEMTGASTDTGTAEDQDTLQKSFEPLSDADQQLDVLKNLIETRDKVKVRKAMILHAQGI